MTFPQLAHFELRLGIRYHFSQPLWFKAFHRNFHFYVACFPQLVIDLGMGFDYYGAFVESARQRIAALEAQRTAIDAEIAALEQSIRAFEPLSLYDPDRIDPVFTPMNPNDSIHPSLWSDPDIGLTDA
ncbi:MAG: hypothetical protein JO336_06355, partial [Acidobacteriia bacterium]|nr:hypothetical protein [Terriglobia bacterium]